LKKEFKTITCPRCKRTEVAGNYSDKPQNKQTDNQLEEDTVLRTQTRVISDKIYMPAKLSMVKDEGHWVEKDNPVIELKRGENTLGRKASNSLCSIQLPTTDPYISKKHAIIDVVMKSDATFEHRLSDNHSKNGTFCNDIKIEPGEVIILSPEDCIRMGRTVFRLVSD